MRRERHNFFLCWLFHLTPPFAAPRRKLVVSPRRTPKINYLPLASNLNCFFQIPKSSAHRFQAWRHSHPHVHFLSGFFLLWHLFNNPLVTVPKGLITIGTIVTFMFHSIFFLFSSKFEVIIPLFTFFQFYSVVSRDSKVDNFQIFFFFFLFIIIRSGLLTEITWSVFMSKPHRSLYVSFSRIGAGLWIYHLLVWSNLNFLNIS